MNMFYIMKKDKKLSIKLFKQIITYPYFFQFKINTTQFKSIRIFKIIVVLSKIIFYSIKKLIHIKYCQLNCLHKIKIILISFKVQTYRDPYIQVYLVLKKINVSPRSVIQLTSTERKKA